jgi:methyl-accepting chemotaxis protein
VVTEISAACREQDIGASQINEAIQQLDQVTQQNASAAEQMTATSDALSSQAEELQSSIAYFRIDAAGPVHTHSSASKPVHLASQAGRPAGARPPLRSAAAKSPSKLLAAKTKFTPAPKVSGKGVALELTTGGPDETDRQFRSF